MPYVAARYTPEEAAVSVSQSESVTMIETNINDLNPQFYETANKEFPEDLKTRLGMMTVYKA